jgi:UDP-N-acetyl-D-glucosamine dehydrogenase
VKVAIIGQGYVGLTIAASAARVGHNVVGLEINHEIAKRLVLGESHIEGIKSADLKQFISAGTYLCVEDPAELASAEIVIITVPTPLDDDRNPDLSAIYSACDIIAANFSSPVLVINESTSFPGTLRQEIAGRVFNSSGVKHLYAVSPERVDPGNQTWNTKNTPRLVSGLDDEATEKAIDFYSSFCDEVIKVSSPEVAEAAKLFENSFRQINIALVNEFAQISHTLGFSAREVIDAAATKPYGFMPFSPGAGVGGHCIPLDPSYLAFVAERAGVPATFIKRANEVNLAMPSFIAQRVVEGCGGDIKGKKVVVVGLAYKANIADTRESPAEAIIEILRNQEAIVTWHDPLVSSWRGESSDEISGADIAVVITLHDVISVDEILKTPYVFDCTGKIPSVEGI